MTTTTTTTTTTIPTTTTTTEQDYQRLLRKQAELERRLKDLRYMISYMESYRKKESHKAHKSKRLMESKKERSERSRITKTDIYLDMAKEEQQYIKDRLQELEKDLK